ncbi:MAG: carboxypeptidase-like regulatory domain-containing protein [Chitinophagaceae bacterium]|nr:carboxypeptidase-like regulatory domain-containing protein [Chitinophagaceae bacterium]
MKIFFLIVLLVPGLFIQAQDKGRTADTTISFLVMGNCDMCKKRIEEAAKGKGVSKAQWDQVSKALTVTYQPRVTSVEKIHDRIATAGHDTPLRTARDEVYNALPDCCLYRAGSHLTMEEDAVYGVVLEIDAQQQYKPLAGASILLGGTTEGLSTNENGYFKIPHVPENGFLLVSYSGFQASRIDIQPGQHLSIILNAAHELQEVRIISSRRPAYVSPQSVIRTQIMTDKELTKAACCNLSESFETNSSVDVSFNDGVTGTKQIQLMGLAGQYTYMTVENMPGPRGLAIAGGLNSIPGTWIESIQLTKGPGSVLNGPEGLAGQVNIELKKPEKMEKLFLNGYVNQMGKTDLNLNLSRQLSKKWSTALLVHHAFMNNREVDFNEDGFRDIPTGTLSTLLNRWRYDNGKGMMVQAGARLLWEDKTAGQTQYDPAQHRNSMSVYGMGMESRRYELFGKWGYVFPKKKYSSLGLQVSHFVHDQEDHFSWREYSARQGNLYANLIYQSIFSNTNHKFKTGLSYTTDDIQEKFINQSFDRVERTSGAFFEYSGSSGKQWEWVIGLRGDQNNLYGFYVTPRVHLRFQPRSKTVVRLSAGRGQRTANILAENRVVFISARNLSFLNTSPGKAYGLDPEIAWNLGISLDQRFRLAGRDGNIAFDLFHTYFQNQVVIDMEGSAKKLDIYNLDGKSFANSFQTEIQYEVLPRLDARIAYRYYDVQVTYQGSLKQKPFVSPHRAFINLAYTLAGWKWDATLSYYSPKRLPTTEDNPVGFRFPERSPGYTLLNMQVSKSLGKNNPLEFYLGGENLGGIIQKELIIAPQDPFGPLFDASLVWGPVTGRMLYAGFRWKIGE